MGNCPVSEAGTVAGLPPTRPEVQALEKGVWVGLCFPSGRVTEATGKQRVRSILPEVLMTLIKGDLRHARKDRFIQE